MCHLSSPAFTGEWNRTRLGSRTCRYGGSTVWWRHLIISTVLHAEVRRTIFSGEASVESAEADVTLKATTAYKEWRGIKDSCSKKENVIAVAWHRVARGFVLFLCEEFQRISSDRYQSKRLRLQRWVSEQSVSQDEHRQRHPLCSFEDFRWTFKRCRYSSDSLFPPDLLLLSIKRATDCML